MKVESRTVQLIGIAKNRKEKLEWEISSVLQNTLLYERI